MGDIYYTAERTDPQATGGAVAPEAFGNRSRFARSEHARQGARGRALHGAPGDETFVTQILPS